MYVEFIVSTYFRLLPNDSNTQKVLREFAKKDPYLIGKSVWNNPIWVEN